MEEKEIELLAPAGSYETLVSVVNAGADAVYCGGTRFGARAYAKNFSDEEMLAGIEYAHLHGAKVYLTINTCLKNRELFEVPAYLAPFYCAGLDAVLVQDLGVLSVVRREFPALPVHASTQMGITSAHGAKFLKNLGVRRIVTARELSLTELCAIHEAVDIELEAFIHGALCYSYSGQCLMSSLLGGRSGNRGRCAGTCRLPFSIDGKEPCYPLSLKDLCAIEFLPQILESGVTSLKIEGRMKSAEYASGVTSVYRRCLDRYFSDTAEWYTKEDREELLSLGSRSGFTEGYFFQRNGADMVTFGSPSYIKDSDEALLERYGTFRVKRDLPVTGSATLRAGEPIRLSVRYGDTEVETTGAACEIAKSRPLTEADVKKQLTKTGESPFAFTGLTVTLDGDVFLPVQELNRLRREALAALSEELQSAYRRKAPERSMKEEAAAGEAPVRMTAPVDTPEIPGRSADTPEVVALVSTAEQLAAALEGNTVTTVLLDSYLYERENFLPALRADVTACAHAGKQAVYALPYVFRKESADFYTEIWEELCKLPLADILARSYDALGFLYAMQYPKDKVRLDERLYTWSDEAAAAFARLGFLHRTLPVELNEKELLHQKRDHAELIIYGRLPLMISAGCVKKHTKGCDRKKDLTVLTDRYQKEFPVRNDCTDCVNLLYNADVLDLRDETEAIRRLSPESIRYSFTTEDKETVKRVLRGEALPDVRRTRGHFQRGVE